MSRPQSKKDLADAGRRKLEAFRKQKAKAKGSQPALKDADGQYVAPPAVPQAQTSAISLDDPISSDALLTRAASVLPISTPAQPTSVGGSEEDALNADRLAFSNAFASSSQAAEDDNPMRKAVSPAGPLVHIPFMGDARKDRASFIVDPFESSSSSRQQPLPEVAAAAAPAEASRRQTSAPAYRSRLPPPPPVFKPPSRPPASTGYPSTSTSPGQSVNPLPWRPAMLGGLANHGSTSSTGQQSASPPLSLRPAVIQFHPAAQSPNSTSSPQHQTAAASPSSRSSNRQFSNAEGQFGHAEGLVGSAEGQSSYGKHSGSNTGFVSSPVQSPSSLSHTGPVKEVGQEAATSPGGQSASQLSLLDERQGIPGVATGRIQEGPGQSGTLGGSLRERDSFLPGASIDRQAKVSTPGAKVSTPRAKVSTPGAKVSTLRGINEVHKLAVEAESPDSPLVFPWLQGPPSTGAASAYASLSDSYLSRPPSHTPSQASSQVTSPTKHAQHGPFNGDSPPQQAQHGVPAANSSAHSFSLTSSSPGPASPPQHAKHAFQMVPSTASPLATGSPLAHARPPAGSSAQVMSSPASSGPVSDGPASNGPVSIAPWRQPLIRPSGAQAQAVRSHLHDGISAPPQPLLSRDAAPQLLEDLNHRLAQQDPQQSSSYASDDNSLATQQLQQLPGVLTRQAALQVPWEQSEPRLGHDSSQMHRSNGFKGSQGDLASRASSSNDGLTASADGLGHEAAKPSGGLPSMHRDSLANGTLPAKPNNFTALQQHIDDLTKEKFELVRGLKEQQKMAASLAEENLLVTEDFNRQAEALQQSRKELMQLESGLQGQQQSMDQLAAERDACKSGAHEAADRSKSLAAEVVALEEKVLHVRSREIRLEKETERLQEGLQQADRQLQTSRQDRASLQATIDMLQEEKRSLLVKLRQAASSSDAQADTAQMRHASSQQAATGTAKSQQQQQEEEEGSVSASTAGNIPASSSRDAEGEEEAMAGRLNSGAGVSTSARLTDKAMAEYNKQQQQQQQQQQQAVSNSLQGGLSRSLARLLPKGQGAAEQQQLVESVHAMIGELEVEKQTFLVALDSQQVELYNLTAVNSELQRKLESQTQRLELAIQQQAHASPHATAPSSSFAAVSSIISDARWPGQQPARPQLQQMCAQLQPAGPQLWQGAQGWQHQAERQGLQQHQQEVAVRQPSGEGKAASGGADQVQGKEQWQSAGQHAQSAPPTPQQIARRPLRAPSGPRRGVFGWLGDVIAPHAKRQQSLMA